MTDLKIALLFSGGVDSSVATHLLCEAGYKPDLFYIKIGMDTDDDLTCTAEEDLEIATATAHRYGLRLEVVDLQQEYWDRVVGYTIDRVRRGLTPNPDVMCNRLIKFGCFEERVGHLYDKIVTGHYAQIKEIDGKVWLAAAKDPIKDQTDFLAQLSPQQVAKLWCPLGSLLKEEVRAVAERAGLLSAKRKDSQGICFLGKINYNQFIERFLGEKPGDIIELETGNKLGRHRGFWFHTIGQRKGLGLGGGPWFVVKKDITRNLIYVSKGYDTEKQFATGFTLEDFHFITADPWPAEGEFPIQFKVRHTEVCTPGTLIRSGQRVYVRSSRPIQGVAPGQFGVIYDAQADLCIGSGEIGEAERL